VIKRFAIGILVEFEFMCSVGLPSAVTAPIRPIRRRRSGAFHILMSKLSFMRPINTHHRHPHNYWPRRGNRKPKQVKMNNNENIHRYAFNYNNIQLTLVVL